MAASKAAAAKKGEFDGVAIAVTVVSAIYLLALLCAFLGLFDKRDWDRQPKTRRQKDGEEQKTEGEKQSWNSRRPALERPDDAVPAPFGQGMGIRHEADLRTEEFRRAASANLASSLIAIAAAAEEALPSGQPLSFCPRTALAARLLGSLMKYQDGD